MQNNCPISRRLIIPYFIDSRGCSNRCIFCPDHFSAASSDRNKDDEALRDIVSVYLRGLRPGKYHAIQLAFYGINFTGLERGIQDRLLSLGKEYVSKGSVHSLRISTRPDCLDEECITRLKCFSVKTVEIGAQSMNDEVLAKSRRGHSSHDVERALFLLKQNGIETGVHLMAGLPGDNLNSFIKSVESIIDLRPDMLRIHPVLIFKDTALHALYLKGQYRPLDLENAVDWCRRAVLRCERAGIPVIRVGLHPTVKIENDLVAGPYHPAFRSLVEGKIFFDMASNLLSNVSNGIDEALFKISPYDGSAFRGLNNRNMKKLRQISDPVKILVQEDPKHLKGSLTLKAGTASYRIDRLSMSHG